MDGLINKTYVIIDKDNRRPSRNTISSFKKNGLKLRKWNKIKDKNLTENKIEEVTTLSCNYFCSQETIANWLTHYKLWKHIVRNEEDRVLILEDNIYPVKNFKKRLIRYWDTIPADWDLIYLGCDGSCKSDILTDLYYQIINGRNNQKVDKHIIKPSYPKGFYGYILSYEGAKKLINNKVFKEVHNDIDKHFANKIIGKSDFKVYAFTPQLVYRKENEPDVKMHEIGNPIGENKSIHYRPLGIDITSFAILLMTFSILVGFMKKGKIKNNYLIIILAIYLAELAYTKSNDKKNKTIIVELILIFSFYYIGVKIRNLFEKNNYI